jgi:hypothetical protein
VDCCLHIYIDLPAITCNVNSISTDFCIRSEIGPLLHTAVLLPIMLTISFLLYIFAVLTDYNLNHFKEWWHLKHIGHIGVI